MNSFRLFLMFKIQELTSYVANNRLRKTFLTAKFLYCSSKKLSKLSRLFSIKTSLSKNAQAKIKFYYETLRNHRQKSGNAIATPYI